MLLVAPAAMNMIAPRVFEAAKLVALAPLASLLLAACACVLWQRRQGPRPGTDAGGNQPGTPPRNVVFAFAALAACMLLATLASENPPVAWLGSYFRREGMAAWLIAALPGAAMLFLLRDAGQLRRALDALLLCCLLPCTYALMQRYGLVPEPGGVLLPISRPGGTLGNPVFLGDFAMLLVPLTLARLLGVPGWRARAPFAVLLALQAWTLLATQSRAPLAAVLLALWLFAMLVAALRGSRRLVHVACALAGTALLFMLLINAVPAAGAALRDVPVLGRLVLVGGDASGASRLGIWQAGWETMRNAPIGRQLFGYGFDVAYQHYFAHLPAGVLGIEGDGDLTDRLHNEVLELWAGMGLFGLVAYMVCTGLLLRAARVALAGGDVIAGDKNRRARHASWFAPIAAGLVAAMIAVGAGQAGLAGIAAGVAAGLAWGVMLVLPLCPAYEAREPDERQLLIAALSATVLAFWMDAQMSLPVMSTRMVFFALAALLALLAAPSAQVKMEEILPRENAGLYGWMAGVLSVVALVAFCPAPLGLIYPVPQAQGWARALLLAAPLAAAALCLAGAGRSAVLAMVTAALSCALPAGVGYAGLGMLWQTLFPQLPEEVLAAPVLWIWIWLPLACLGWAWWRKQRVAVPSPSAAALLLALALPLIAWAATAGWDELRADNLARLAGRALNGGDFDTAAARAMRAAALRPGEPQYRATLGRWRLERVLAELQNARGGRAEDYLYLADQLRTAEADMRAALALAPDDPRALSGLANVLQFKGSKAMRPLFADAESGAAVLEARTLFSRAHALYPVHVGILVNWAQLEFDGGNATAAFQLLDRAEALQPRNGSPYLERLRMARFAGDAAQEAATWQRARSRLPASALARLEQALAVARP
jgi:O-antigen ligase